MIKELLEKFRNHSATVAIIGLGYVGLPLAEAFSFAGFAVVGFDIDDTKVEALNDCRSYIRTIPAERIAAMVDTGQFRALIMSYSSSLTSLMLSNGLNKKSVRFLNLMEISLKTGP